MLRLERCFYVFMGEMGKRCRQERIDPGRERVTVGIKLDQRPAGPVITIDGTILEPVIYRRYQPINIGSFFFENLRRMKGIGKTAFAAVRGIFNAMQKLQPGRQLAGWQVHMQR